MQFKRRPTDSALDWLEKSVELGFRDAAHLSKDTDLDSLRGQVAFRKLEERLKRR